MGVLLSPSKKLEEEKVKEETEIEEEGAPPLNATRRESGYFAFSIGFG
jgi:hypothetical protein